MTIKSTAQAGSFESSDILVLVEPAEGRKIELDSSVYMEYKESILEDIVNVLDRYDVSDIRLIAKDKGALGVTITSRVETALLRAAGQQKGTVYETH